MNKINNNIDYAVPLVFIFGEKKEMSQDIESSGKKSLELLKKMSYGTYKCRIFKWLQISVILFLYNCNCLKDNNKEKQNI